MENNEKEIINEEETTMEFNENSEIIKETIDEKIEENNKKEEIIRELVQEPKNDNKNKKIIIIFASIITLLLIIILVLFILVFNKPKDKDDNKKIENTTEKKENIDKDDEEKTTEEETEEEEQSVVELPNLKNENKSYAESKLKELGLFVEFEYQDSETINKDFVIGYKDNNEGDEIDVGEYIVVVISSGTKYITLGNYVGKDANTIKTQLEAKELVVTLTAKKVTEADKVANGSIISQSITSGTKIEKGETIELVYAQLVETYPDFTNGEYTKDTILSFCSKNKLTCSFTEKQSEKESGTILSQNFEKGTEVKEGSTLQIDIAQ